MVIGKSPSDPLTSDSPGYDGKLSRADVIGGWLGLAILSATVLEFLFKPLSLQGFQRFSWDESIRSFSLRLDVVLAGVFLAVFCIVPVAAFAVRFLRGRWRDWYTYIALLGACAFLWAFILHFGRWQFGAFDFNILIEMGWRQSLGQRPYIDFPATTPPGFNLGVKYAFKLFGANWDANLYFCAMFACISFLWTYWLMRVLSLGRLASAATASAIECAAMLTLCFWWYNNSALVLAAVFYLSCLAYVREPRIPRVQASYFLSLTLLSMMKPNTAGLTIAAGVLLVLLVTDRKVRLVLLTLGAAAAAVLLLAVNHVSVPAMLASYLSVAKGRGGISARFAYRQMTTSEKRSAWCWLGILSVPLLGLAPRMVRLASGRDWKGIAYCCLFPMSLAVALYGLATNGEYRDVECTMLLVAGAVLTFGLRWNGPFLRRFYIAVLCASMVGDLYYGAVRARVYSIGPHMFFEWQDNEHFIESGFLKNMRVSSTMKEVEREVELAKDANPGPYFFGSRLDFNYAVLGLPSPEHFPAWWHPGTAFGVSEQTPIIHAWQDHRFETLIFLKTDDPAGFDHTYYPQEFLDAISRDYVDDDHYRSITVRHRRAPDP